MFSNTNSFTSTSPNAATIAANHTTSASIVVPIPASMAGNFATGFGVPHPINGSLSNGSAFVPTGNNNCSGWMNYTNGGTSLGSAGVQNTATTVIPGTPHDSLPGNCNDCSSTDLQEHRYNTTTSNNCQIMNSSTPISRNHHQRKLGKRSLVTLSNNSNSSSSNGPFSLSSARSFDSSFSPNTHSNNNDSCKRLKRMEDAFSSLSIQQQQQQQFEQSINNPSSIFSTTISQTKTSTAETTNADKKRSATPIIQNTHKKQQQELFPLANASPIHNDTDKSYFSSLDGIATYANMYDTTTKNQNDDEVYQPHTQQQITRMIAEQEQRLQTKTIIDDDEDEDVDLVSPPLPASILGHTPGDQPQQQQKHCKVNARIDAIIRTSRMRASIQAASLKQQFQRNSLQKLPPQDVGSRQARTMKQNENVCYVDKMGKMVTSQSKDDWNMPLPKKLIIPKSKHYLSFSGLGATTAATLNGCANPKPVTIGISKQQKSPSPPEAPFKRTSSTPDFFAPIDISKHDTTTVNKFTTAATVLLTRKQQEIIFDRNDNDMID